MNGMLGSWAVTACGWERLCSAPSQALPHCSSPSCPTDNALLHQHSCQQVDQSQKTFFPALWWLNIDRRQGLTDLYTDKLLLATLSKIVLIFMGYRLNLMYHVIAYVTLNLFSPVWWQTIQTFSLSGLSLGDFVGRWQSHHSQPFSTTGRHS